MKKPFFSIIMTIYNGSSTLLESIESIFNQTFTDFELIVFNDGSIDSSHDLLNNLLKKYSFVYKNYSKIGRVNLLNEGIDHANGKYICICDCDDIWHPQKLEFQYDFLRKNNNAKFVCTNVKHFSKKYSFENFNLCTSHKIPNYWFYLFNPICHSSIAFEKCNLRYKNQLIHDYVLYLDFLNSKHSLYILDQELTFNRIHSNQNFQSKGIIYFLKTQDVILSQILSTKKYYFLVFYVLKFFYHFSFGILRRRFLLK